MHQSGHQTLEKDQSLSETAFDPLASFIIHIGYPKTGTTYLQSRAFPALNKRGTVNYIALRTYQTNYITTTDGFSFSTQRVHESLRDFVKEGPNLLSCEAFTGAVFYKSINNFEVARRLKSSFPNARILISIRNQVSLVHSLYCQYIHEGGHLSLENFLGFENGEFCPTFWIDDHRFNLNCLFFDRAIEAYTDLFGKDSVTVVFFEEFVRSKQVFMKKLVFDLFGYEPESDLELPSTIENRSFGKNQILISRLFSPLIRSHFNRTGLLPINRRFRRLLQSNLSFRIFGQNRRKTPEIDQAIHDYFKESNLNLFENVIRTSDEQLKSKYLGPQLKQPS